MPKAKQAPEGAEDPAEGADTAGGGGGEDTGQGGADSGAGADTTGGVEDTGADTAGAGGDVRGADSAPADVLTGAPMEGALLGIDTAAGAFAVPSGDSQSGVADQDPKEAHPQEDEGNPAAASGKPSVEDRLSALERAAGIRYGEGE